MFARLLWKDARLFWPVWVFLALAAAAVQWGAVRYYPREVGNGGLALMAAGWTALYALAVAAAAFAGEKETGTLRLLDTMPVGRARLWWGKAVFALATTAALGAALVALSTLGTTRWQTGIAGPGATAATAGVLLFEVVGWGLLCSALAGNALSAATAAIFCCTFSLLFVRVGFAAEAANFVEATPYHLALALATAAASGLIVVGTGPPGFRARWSGILSPRPVAVVPRREVLTAEAPAAPAYGRHAVWGLAWETVREGGGLALRLAVVGLVLPALIVAAFGSSGLGLALVINVAVGLTAGVHALGSEEVAGTKRFLAHHGARPGLVWAVKNAVWASWLAVLWAPWALVWAFSVVTGSVRIVRPFPDELLGILGTSATCYAVGHLAGMVIRRRLTAWVVALVVLMAFGVQAGALYSQNMMPGDVLVLVPLAVLAVGWAWSADWLLEPQGAGRWLRLAGLCLAASAVTLGYYAARRAWGVADVGPVAAALDTSALPPAGENAAALYREADVLSRRQNDAGPSQVREDVCDVLRRASLLPTCRFAGMGDWLDFPKELPPGFAVLGEQMQRSVRDRESRGDLAGAWDDILVLFRMARQISGPAPMNLSVPGSHIERNALSLALRWSADPRLTPEQVREALVSYRDFPPFPRAVETIRHEAALGEKLFNRLDGPTRQRVVSDALSLAPTTLNGYWADIVAAPWEVTRARRGQRLLFGAFLHLAAKEPVDRFPVGWAGVRADDVAMRATRTRLARTWLSQGTPPVNEVLASTPLLKAVFPNFGPLIETDDLNEVARRALVQVLALRHWQLTHGGQLPAALGEIVPSELASLPLDPYSGKPFGYIVARGSQRLTLGYGTIEAPGVMGSGTETLPADGRTLLYSVGRDGWNDRAEASQTPESLSGDLIFPLPLPSESGA
jgi:hypothetical protein